MIAIKIHLTLKVPLLFFIIPYYINLLYHYYNYNNSNITKLN